MSLTAKEWEKTRPSECKGSGIGEACKNWTKHCTADVEKIAQNDKAVSNAIKTIQAFFDAKKTAETKLTKCKDPKKVSATKDLLGKWETLVKQFQGDLSAETLKSNLEDVTQKRMTEAAKKFSAIIKSNEESIVTIAGKLMNEADAALKKKDLETAESKITSALHKLKNAASFVTKPDEGLQAVVKDIGPIPTDRFNLKAFTGELNDIKKLWKAGRERALALQKKWDELNDGADVDEEEHQKDLDKTTKANIKTVLAMYKKCLADMNKPLAKMQKLLGQAKQVNGNPLLKKNPDGMVTVMGKLRKSMLEAEEEAKQVLFDIREGTGKCVLKRREFFPNGSEEAGKVMKVFTPFMTRGVSINGRIITLQDDAENEFREALQTIIDDGSSAAPDAKKLLAEL